MLAGTYVRKVLCFVVPFVLVIHRVAVPGILDRAVRADDAKVCVVLAFEAKPTPAAEARGVGSRTDYAADGGVESHNGTPAKLL